MLALVFVAAASGLLYVKERAMGALAFSLYLSVVIGEVASTLFRICLVAYVVAVYAKILWKRDPSYFDSLLQRVQTHLGTAFGGNGKKDPHRKQIKSYLQPVKAYVVPTVGSLFRICRVDQAADRIYGFLYGPDTKENASVPCDDPKSYVYRHGRA